MAVFVGLIGSVYNDQIVRAFPFVLPQAGWTVSYNALVFWIALLLLAGCVFLRQVVDDHARAMLTTSAEAAERTSQRIENLVQTLPPRAFQTELARTATKVHAVVSAARSTEAGSSAERLAQVIRHVLQSIASLALIYDDKPLISGRESRYSANIMLFVPVRPDHATIAVSFFPDDQDRSQLTGVLRLRRELSACSEPGADPEPDTVTPEILLPVPKVVERAGRSTALPGAPHAFLTGETAGYQDTGTLLDWCRTKGDFQPSVIDELEKYFSTGPGRHIRSFVSTPLTNHSGVLNIHADRTAILGPALERREIFQALVTPILLNLGDLVGVFIETETRELNAKSTGSSINTGSAT